MSRAIATTDHDVIRRWAEARDGHPAVVKAAAASDHRGGLLRIDFEPPEPTLDEIEWSTFFDTFEQNNLAFLYQEKTPSGRRSRFNKLVDRDSIEASSGSEVEEDEEEESEEEEEEVEEEDEDDEEDDRA